MRQIAQRIHHVEREEQIAIPPVHDEVVDRRLRRHNLGLALEPRLQPRRPHPRHQLLVRVAEVEVAAAQLEPVDAKRKPVLRLRLEQRVVKVRAELARQRVEAEDEPGQAVCDEQVRGAGHVDHAVGLCDCVQCAQVLDRGSSGAGVLKGEAVHAVGARGRREGCVGEVAGDGVEDVGLGCGRDAADAECQRELVDELRRRIGGEADLVDAGERADGDEGGAGAGSEDEVFGAGTLGEVLALEGDSRWVRGSTEEGWEPEGQRRLEHGRGKLQGDGVSKESLPASLPILASMLYREAKMGIHAAIHIEIAEGSGWSAVRHTSRYLARAEQTTDL